MHQRRAQSTGPPKISHRWLRLGICISLAVLTWVVFGQLLQYDFINYDDPRYVYENTNITNGLTIGGIAWAFTHIHSMNWHPLTTISHMLDCQLYGLKPGAHHFTNVLLHSIVAILLLLVLQRMTGGPSGTGSIWRSAFVAAVFAIHPLRVESVAWIAERKDVLSGVFFMLTLLTYFRYVRVRSIGHYLTVLFMFALGLMCKPMLVTLPFVLLVLDYWPLGRIRGQKSDVSGHENLVMLVVEKIPLVGLSAISSVVTFLAQRGAVGRADRYTYLPQIGLYIAITWGIADVTAAWRWQREILTAGTAIVVGLLSWRASVQASYWRDSETLFTHALAVTSNNDVAENNLGIVFLQKGNLDEAISLLQAAVDLRPENSPAHENLAKALLQKGQVTDALVHYRRLLELQPDNIEVHNIVGTVLIQQGQAREAVEEWQKVLAIQPDNGNAMSNLAWVFATSPDDSLRDGAKAVQLAEQAMRISGGRIPIIFRTLAAA